MGLAETTPGPVLIVLQHVGFPGGWHQYGHLHPLLSATLGAFVSSWATFSPSFFWIFVGAPSVERFQAWRQLRFIFRAISAAVSGLILNLALRLGRRVIVDNTGHPAWFNCGVCAFTLWGVLRRQWSFHWLASTSALVVIAKAMTFS